MTNTEIDTDRLAGSVYGLAVGDAYGDPIEFAHPPMNGQGPSAPLKFRITDDTQMSLAVWDALQVWDGEDVRDLRQELAVTFDTWYDEQSRGWARAPGNTCMSALAKLQRLDVTDWEQATSHHSAGCGSVMRAPWVGLHSKVTDEQIFSVAAMQAVLTHGPAENAFAAAALAELTRAIARGVVAPGAAALWLCEWANAHEGMAYDYQALGSGLWAMVITSDSKQHHVSPESYVREGVEHVRWIAQAADSLTNALADNKPFTIDPADYSGEGWRAREAVAMAVGIFDHGLGYGASIRVAAWTRGDSDSTAAITGAIVGVYQGINAVPSDWIIRLEDRYARELAEVVRG
jgi:ADP-ribosylglycohydrolase